MSWMYGPSCTALPRIGSDCSTHPVWRHDDESTWAARIRVCCWLLFLMLVKVCVCRARSAAKAWLSALVTASVRGTDVSGSPLTKSPMMLLAGMSPSVWPASTAQAVSASVVGSYPAAGVIWVCGKRCSSRHCARSSAQSPPLRSLHVAWKRAMLSRPKSSARTLVVGRPMWRTLLPDRCSGRLRRLCTWSRTAVRSTGSTTFMVSRRASVTASSKPWKALDPCARPRSRCR